MRVIISSFFLLILFVDVYAQTHQCGFNDHMDQRYEQDPSLLEMRSDYEDEIQAIINSRSSFVSKTIPVVVETDTINPMMNSLAPIEAANSGNNGVLPI